MKEQTVEAIGRGCTVRDRLWLWTHAAGSHDTDYGSMPRPSRMTPAEGAFYMGVPNVMFIRYKGNPPLEQYDQYALSFRPLDRVVWSLTGASGATSEDDVRRALDLAAHCPNLTGFVLDDFFRPPAGSGNAALTVEQLRGVRQRLAFDGRQRELFVVFYDADFERPVRAHLDLIDHLCFCTWMADDVRHLERNFERLERSAPGHGIYLGCYLYDYGKLRPMPLDLMQHQCECALRWLHKGRVQGVIFLTNNVCDLGFEAVEWTRQWIAQVGGQPLALRP